MHAVRFHLPVFGAWLLAGWLLLGYAPAFGQAKTKVFARMPRQVKLKGRQLTGEKPSEDYQVEQAPLRLQSRRKWQRNGRQYRPLVVYHNGWPAYNLDLRPTDSVVYAAIDSYIQQSDELWRAGAWAKTPYDAAKLKQLTDGRRKLAQTLPAALTQYETPLFKFNAQVGQKWRCYTGIRRSVDYLDVELLKTGTDVKGRPLFLYGVRFVPVVPHFPAMQQVLVSPRRGIIGACWYEYVCWGSATNCYDWTVQYGAALK